MRTKRRLRVEWQPWDCWVGVFWRRHRWLGGSYEMLVANTDDTLDHRALDVWICLLPMLPLHYTRQSCPRPDECRSLDCFARRTLSLREWSRDVGLPEPTADLLRDREEQT